MELLIHVLGVKFFVVVINYMILLFTVTINEIKVCDNWLNIEGSIQLKLTWSKVCSWKE